jgi:hypothetical protein
MMALLPLQDGTRRTGQGTLEADVEWYVVAARFGVAVAVAPRRRIIVRPAAKVPAARSSLAAGRTADAAAAPISYVQLPKYPLDASVWQLDVRVGPQRSCFRQGS